MTIIKRNGKTEQLSKKKISDSLTKANNSVNDDERLTQKQIKRISDSVVEFCENLEEPIDIDVLEDVIEQKIMASGAYEVAKKYITYRYEKERIRQNKSLTEKLTAANVQNQNANVDEFSFGGRMGETASYVTRQYALEHLVSKKARHNHNNNEIYIHDADQVAVGSHNCLSIPFDKLLAEGFNTRQCDVRPAGSINTAFQLVAVLFQIQSLQQFGGVSATHLDWTMVPFVRLSFYKHYRDGLKYIEKREIENVPTKEKIKSISIESDYYVKESPAYKYAMDKTVEELDQAVEGFYHNLNTLQSRSGSQLPFSSSNYGTCTLPEGRMVIKSLLLNSIKGVGKLHKTPIFPCGIFQCMKGVNRKPGDPNYDLFQLALKSTSLRLYPNYANVDWSGNAGYDPENPQTYFSTMGCHGKDTLIHMADGSRKLVQNVAVGDKVMGPDGTPRTVLELIRGTDTLFRITQSNGEPYIVNEGHVLSLKYTGVNQFMGKNPGDTVNIRLHDFVALPDHVKASLVGYKTCGTKSAIDVTRLDPGEFYGFDIDGDRLYVINDGTVTHNCRTANGWDINCDNPKLGQLKDGRGNICPVTIIMPTLAMQAKEKEGDIVENFMKLLDRKINEARDMLLERFDWICSQPAKSAKFMYENGTMYGYKPEEGIKSALKHGTLAIGQLGLAETLQILIGCDHTTKKGMELAERIEGLFKEKCAKFKKDLKLNFGVYYTPAENLCYTAMKKFKEKYGEIKNVSDREYFTNSMHVPVWHKLTPFEKIDIESKLTGYSSAGCITYVELDSSAKNNTGALEELVNYAMDKDIPYFAVNVPNDTCRCGFTGDIPNACPKCGSTDIQRLRRVTGYLTGDYKTAFNYGKQCETENRVKHSGTEA